MVFNSYIFWFFFAVVIILYRLLPHRGQNRMLLVASYVFYGTWDYRFLSLIVASTIVDYFVAKKIAAPGIAVRQKKRWAAVSITFNLGLLGFFKYFGFFADSFRDLLQWTTGIEASPFVLDIVLPVGISFYTFQTLSYTIDVFRGDTEPVDNFLDFALYVSFFPQLVAGPIERSHHLMPQILTPRPRRADDFTTGLYLVAAGLFMKVAVADNLAVIANASFKGLPEEVSGFACLLGIYCFAIQIYGDFYGYSSIARGIARWMGFDLMANFRMPYLSRSPSEFWQRWHISLSSWLRDYLYIPLGGNRGGKWLTQRNLMITMLLGGLWHGAGWTFILWGLFHGLLLCAYRPFEAKLKLTRSKWVRALQTVLFFHLVCFGWLLFRAESVGQVGDILYRICTDFTASGYTSYAMGMIVFFFAPFFIYEAWLERKGDLLALTKVRWGWRAAAYTYVAYMLLLCQPLITTEFIYFQF